MADNPAASGPEGNSGGTLPGDSTIDLLDQFRRGDRSALERLYARYLPRLHRWARGRLPHWARDGADTQDLVQDALLKTFKQVDRFEVRREGAFQAYLREAVMNRIRDELRRVNRRPSVSLVDETLPSHEPSPLSTAIGGEAFERYEAALARLRPIEREVIIGRVEMAWDYEELARMLELPSAEAARKAARRALVRLAREMSL